ncbi:hypothetical protein ACFLYR_09535, partial [Chloroflexota bacterium]
MFPFGSYLTLTMIAILVFHGKFLTSISFPIYAPLNASCFILCFLSFIGIGFITINSQFLSMKQLHKIIGDTGPNVVVIDSFSDTIQNSGSTRTRNALNSYKHLAARHGLAFILLLSLVERPSVAARGEGRRIIAPIRMYDISGSKVLCNTTDTIIGVDRVDNDKVEIAFLKNRLSRVPFDRLLSFNFNPDRAVPFLATEETRLIVELAIGNSHRVEDDCPIICDYGDSGSG